MSSLITGEARSSRYLHIIARELATTPAFLSGETDDPDEDAPPAPNLDSEERELIDHFGDLAPADRRALLQIAKSMASGAAPSETTHSPKIKFKGRGE